MENHKSVLNKSFDLFDDIRNYDNYGKFDFLNLLNQRTNGFDLDFMKALLSDLNLYINIELEEMISNLDPTQLDIQLKSYEISGLKIPMLKRTQRKDLSIEQKSKRKKLEKSIGELSPVIDIEAIMFPFEFYGLREFRSIIINKIKEIELGSSESVKNGVKENKSKSLLIEGKRLNLNDRFEVAKKLFDIESKIRKLNISETEKYKLLALILDINETNARHLMNGKYQGKPNSDIVKNYLDSLNK
ncbi:hypothetical protein JoomaDRAFT_0747 [Galbibacter orientalis DSM 19592]|uniref:Uncharacterized protein n=1 Tax=Galbibacter orientalis DSM 19592 TaxID=926559 RepID=I3C2D8_9FLAO|nr:hypothetical protein [Galbibacter orientalis]EIJ37781.1 hypothetical protein JoomaDRAFT_0747 [Galbibacter orientalis DSM 19592]